MKRKKALIPNLRPTRLVTVALAAVLAAGSAMAGPYAPAAGQTGTTAIHMNDPAFTAWATGAVVERGPMNISEPANGDASHGSPSDAVGPAQGKAIDGVVSLGDGGSATLTFNDAITNGDGADFAVFENGFGSWLELAFVEVSSNGEDFIRFESVSLTQTNTQVVDQLDPTDVYNLAGKCQGGYGTPFDLEELKGVSQLVDFDAITHVRIIDVVGSIDDAYATYDSKGNKVNDPWWDYLAGSATGFDLDAVGVIHHAPEPATLALLMIGGLGAVIRRRGSNS